MKRQHSTVKNTENKRARIAAPVAYAAPPADGTSLLTPAHVTSLEEVSRPKTVPVSHFDY